MKKIHQKLFVAFVIGILSLPLLHLVGFTKDVRLAGIDPKTDLPTWKEGVFRTRQFQREFENWWSSHYAFRNVLLRTKNQIYDWVNFGKFHYGYNQTLIEGKKNHLFEVSSIDSIYDGNCPVDRREISSKLADIKRYADSKNIPLFFILGPNKARLYLDDVPQRFKFFSKKECNHIEEWKKLLSKLGIPFLDAQKFFEKIFEAEQIEPYSPTGTHLNKLGSALLVQEVAKILKLPEIDVERLGFVDKPYLAERDIADLINAWQMYRKNQKFPEVKVSIEDKSKVSEQNILVIGDSYANYIFAYLVWAGLVPNDHRLVSSLRSISEEDARWYWNNVKKILVTSSERNLEYGGTSPQSQINQLWSFLPPHAKSH